MAKNPREDKYYDKNQVIAKKRTTKEYASQFDVKAKRKSNVPEHTE